MNTKMAGSALVAIAGAAVLLMGARTMYLEATPNMRGGSTAISRIANMADGSAPIGLTLLTQHHALLDCEQTLRSSVSLEIQYLSPDQRERLPKTCAQMARNIVARSPADSFAWFVSAAAAAAMSDPLALNADLERSQVTGPNEGWLASMRLELAENNLASLNASTLATHQQDMRIVAATGGYISSVARRFVLDEDFRQRMSAALENMTAKDQARFLSAVRAALNSPGR